MDELVRAFLGDSVKKAETIRRDLDAFVQDPSSTDTLEKIRRSIHTIRYACTFLALSQLEDIARSAEEILVRVRDGDAEATRNTISEVRHAVHRFEAIVADTAGTEAALMNTDFEASAPPKTPSSFAHVEVCEEHLQFEPERGPGTVGFNPGYSTATAGNVVRVLLISDGFFYRNMVIPRLALAGFAVRVEENAGAALGRGAQGEVFEIIICDIERPEMSGFEFAEAAHRVKVWRDTQLVALLVRTAQHDIGSCRHYGFDDCVAKYDCDLLIDRLAELVKQKGAARDGRHRKDRHRRSAP